MVAGDCRCIRCCANSSASCRCDDACVVAGPECPAESGMPDGFRIDLIDERRLLLSTSVEIAESVSPNDRLRVGDRNDAGESEVCRPDIAESDVIGASLLSSVRDSGISR